MPKCGLVAVTDHVKSPPTALHLLSSSPCTLLNAAPSSSRSMSTALVSMARAPLPSPPLSPPAADPVRGAIGHLLSRGYSLPCSTAAQAFIQLVQPTSRFQLALDVLLPLLDPHAPSEVRSQADMLPAADGPGRQAAQRILVSFILYYLYSPHPIAINPFKSALFVTFLAEREKAVNAANVGDVSPNEQLVWVLWKILKGDGSDVCENITMA